MKTIEIGLAGNEDGDRIRELVKQVGFLNADDLDWRDILPCG